MMHTAFLKYNDMLHNEIITPSTIFQAFYYHYCKVVKLSTYTCTTGFFTQSRAHHVNIMQNLDVHTQVHSTRIAKPLHHGSPNSEKALQIVSRYRWQQCAGRDAAIYTYTIRKYPWLIGQESHFANGRSVRLFSYTHRDRASPTSRYTSPSSFHPENLPPSLSHTYIYIYTGIGGKVGL